MRRVIVVEGLANLVVLVAKAIVGFSTGSMAVLGDALHSLSDVANNAVAWVIVGLSAAPPDREHPYGHRKFEVLAVFVLATLLSVVAFELAIRALTREAQAPNFSGWGLIVMVGVLIVNIVLSIWQRRWALRLKSDLLLADASHTFSDVLTTLVVISGWLLSANGYPLLDTLCAVGVSIFVLYLAFGLFRRAVPVLVDGMALDPEDALDRIAQVPGVHEVRRMRSRWIGHERAVDVIVSVAPDMPTSEAHDIADAIESELEENFGVSDTTVHVEPTN